MDIELRKWNRPEPPVESELRRRLDEEGFAVWSWSDGAGAEYKPHTHDHDESLWVIDGHIQFGIAGDCYELGPGDRLMLPHGTVHTALAGPDGATYLVGQKKA
jgi:quercetin dioxygenase-like cupin family protein